MQTNCRGPIVYGTEATGINAIATRRGDEDGRV
jgi:hypothetical protein